MVKLSRLHIGTCLREPMLDVSRHRDRVHQATQLDVLSSPLFADKSDGFNERIFRFERCAHSGVLQGV